MDKAKIEEIRKLKAKIRRLRGNLRQQRIDWMIEHFSLWGYWPLLKYQTIVAIQHSPENYSADQQAQAALARKQEEPICRACVYGLKQDGLIAPSTYWKGVGIITLIDKARAQMGVFK